jgi:hypothetical protein
MNTDAHIALRRELAQRVGGGLEITLYWDPIADRVSVDVYHLATEETITFPIASDRALDAFRHPFAYLPRQRTTLPEHLAAQLLN